MITAQAAANRLLGMSNGGWTQASSNLPAGLLSTAAAALTTAEQEMRSINPAAFAIARQILLNAPASDTCTVSGPGTTITPVISASLPNAGVTVQVGGSTRYNQVASLAAGVGTLLRTHEGETGAGKSLTVWHDCWVPADGATFERILGDVRADGRRLIVLSHPDELARFYRRRDFGQIARGYVEQNFPGRPEVCWTESWQTGSGADVESRLRFFPMPDAQILVEARVVTHSAAITAADFTTTTRKTGTPGGNDELFFWPLVMRQWAMSPWYEPGGAVLSGIASAAQRAIDRLEVWRPQMDAGNVVIR